MLTICGPAKVERDDDAATWKLEDRMMMIKDDDEGETSLLSKKSFEFNFTLMR